MSTVQSDPLAQLNTTCGTLLYELKIIWDEVGESDEDRDKMLLELERECLEVYRRKVDQSNRSRAQLRQAIADYEAELAAICSAMGERPVHLRQSDKPAGSLKEELQKIIPQLEEMRKRKTERKSQFQEVVVQIQKISEEINGSSECSSTNIVVDETDLSSRHLEELHGKLEMLQKEKRDRLLQIHEHLNNLNSLCSVLGMDVEQITNEVSLTDMERPKNIGNDTIKRLAAAIERLREVKLQRMQKLQDLATTMLELWNLMDTPTEEQLNFQNVTRNVAASEHEITEPNTLSMDYINCVEAEVAKLEKLKSSKMKELVLKKRSELEEICRKTHLVPECDTEIDCLIEAIEHGSLDPGYVLEEIELQIAKVKEEAFSRKDILEKVEKWLGACEEESWLEEYNRDENRYNAGRGSHLQLKRAEKARKLVNKLPAMVEGLASKTLAWERERGVEFIYDGVCLLSMLEEYNILRQEKEEEQRRLRDQKKLQGQLIAEQEALYGSKPSPSKAQSVRKAPRMSTGGANRRFSVGGAMLQTPKPEIKSRPSSRKGDRMFPKDDNFSTSSIGSKGLDVAGLLTKKHSFGSQTPREAEPLFLRKPFSPISSEVPSKANVAPLSNGSSEDIRKVVQSNNREAFTTPIKTTTSINDENGTPKAIAVPPPKEVFTTPVKAANVLDDAFQTPKVIPVPLPCTPRTISVPMQTATTPAPPVPLSTTVVEETQRETEYSFEERRAGFVVPKSQLQSTIQV